jgi:hypothetical protein
MSAVANIVLADAQATPVNHTFVPLGPDTNGVWWWEDQSATAEIGYNRISAQLVRPGNPAPGASSANRVSRIKISVHTPILETLASNDAGLTPPPTVAYITRSSYEFISPERNSLENRKTARKYSMNVLNDPQIVAMIELLQNVF